MNWNDYIISAQKPMMYFRKHSRKHFSWNTKAPLFFVRSHWVVDVSVYAFSRGLTHEFKKMVKIRHWLSLNSKKNNF